MQNKVAGAVGPGVGGRMGQQGKGGVEQRKQKGAGIKRQIVGGDLGKASRRKKNAGDQIQRVRRAGAARSPCPHACSQRE